MSHLTSLRLVACLTAAVSITGYAVFAADLPVPVAMAPDPRLPAPSLAADDGPALLTVRVKPTSDPADNALGGIHDGAIRMNQGLLQLHGDTGRAVGWTDGRLVSDGLHENAEPPDIGYVSTAGSPGLADSPGMPTFRLYPAWYRHDSATTNLIPRVDDLATEFASTQPMDVLFSGTHAWDTSLDGSGSRAPATADDTSETLRIRQPIDDQWSVQAAAVIGLPNSARYPNINSTTINRETGAVLIAEADYEPSKTTRMLAGYWDYTGQFPALNQTNAETVQSQISGSNGVYVSGATRVYSQTAQRGLDLLANVSVGAPATQQVERSLNLGLTYTGLLGGRPDDRLGFAVGFAHAANPYRDIPDAAGNGVATSERNFELSYRAPINQWLTIQPDIQYWINPGMDPMGKNDLLFLIHFEFGHALDL